MAEMRRNEQLLKLLAYDLAQASRKSMSRRF